ncbi:MAG: RidA family protein [Chloroflexi bacterium]|nr:RidA family protein [Chloroflexota bacterium]
MQIEKKLEEMGLSLPVSSQPVANYVSSVRVGNILYVSGHIGDLKVTLGQLGKDVTVEQGYEAARKTALVLLSAVKRAIGDLDKVKQIVKLLCMVNSAVGFSDQPAVANGCSDLLVKLYGDRGRHARSAIGFSGLPGNGCIEIEMIVEVED